MIYLKYWLMVVVDLIMKFLIAWPLTPFIVLLADKDGWLPLWLSWFQTYDNSLNGDYGWQATSRPYLAESNKYQRYINRCCWLWRNSIYGFSRTIEGIKFNELSDAVITVGDTGISNGPPGKSGLVRRYLYRDSKIIAFQWYYIKRYEQWPNKCIRINLGRKLWDFPTSEYAMFVFSISPFASFHES
jgi:hypothetical protein